MAVCTPPRSRAIRARELERERPRHHRVRALRALLPPRFLARAHGRQSSRVAFFQRYTAQRSIARCSRSSARSTLSCATISLGECLSNPSRSSSAVRGGGGGITPPPPLP